MRSVGRVIAAAAVLLSGIGLSGCIMGRVYRDQPLDEQKIAAIARGVTTKQEILSEFGPPQEIEGRELVAIGGPVEAFLTRRGERAPVERVVAARFFRYTYARANILAVVLLLFNYGEFDQKTDNLVIFFDGDNRVEDYAYAKRTDQLPRFGFLSR